MHQNIPEVDFSNGVSRPIFASLGLEGFRSRLGHKPIVLRR